MSETVARARCWWQQLAAMMIKEAKQVVRDPSSWIIAVVITTHFMEEAEYCDRIGLIWRGRKIAEGTPDELKASVRTAARPEPTLEDAFIALIEGEAA